MRKAGLPKVSRILINRVSRLPRRGGEGLNDLLAGSHCERRSWPQMGSPDGWHLVGKITVPVSFPIIRRPQKVGHPTRDRNSSSSLLLAAGTSADHCSIRGRKAAAFTGVWQRCVRASEI